MSSVRTHTRRTSGGGTATVHRHDRSNRGKTWSQMQKASGRKRRGPVRRAGGHLKKAWKYSRRKKSTRAFAFGALGSFELGAFAVSRGAMALGAVAFLLVAACVVPVVWTVRRDMRAGQAGESGA